MQKSTSVVMDESTLLALVESIGHWARLATGTARKTEGTGPIDCALCGLFFADNCTGCPVKKTTGKVSCDGSPYEGAAAIAMEGPAYKANDDFKAAAAQELRFLASILATAVVKRKPSRKSGVALPDEPPTNGRA